MRRNLLAFGFCFLLFFGNCGKETNLPTSPSLSSPPIKYALKFKGSLMLSLPHFPGPWKATVDAYIDDIYQTSFILENVNVWQEKEWEVDGFEANKEYKYKLVLKEFKEIDKLAPGQFFQWDLIITPKTEGIKVECNFWPKQLSWITIGQTQSWIFIIKKTY